MTFDMKSLGSPGCPGSKGVPSTSIIDAQTSGGEHGLSAIFSKGSGDGVPEWGAGSDEESFGPAEMQAGILSALREENRGSGGHRLGDFCNTVAVGCNGDVVHMETQVGRGCGGSHGKNDWKQHR
jgi:hypothetical protein